AGPTAGAAPAGEATPAATAVPVSPVPTADVQARLAEFLSIYEITEAEYKQMVEVQVLYRKLEESMGAEVPTSANQVHARHILVETEEKAKELVEKLRNGESFEELAKAESTDAGSKDQGGDLGWFPEGVMVPEFDEVVFKLEPNTISDPVSTTYGWHIIELLEKEENRPLDEQTLNFRKSAALQEWLDKASNGSDVIRSLTQEQLDWVYKKIKWNPPY
ncbi:MAG: peptidylprolyl isomerase, partial [Chloroflexota bacterium]